MAEEKNELQNTEERAYREYLSKFGIYELRNLGRMVGVQSPTNKKKCVLIDEIIAVRSGKKAPSSRSKMGPKTKNSYVSPNTVSGLDELSKQLSEISVAETKKEEDSSAIIEGYYEALSETDGFVRIHGYGESKLDAYMPVAMTRLFPLRNGDYLCCYAIDSEESGMVVTMVININGVNIDRIQRETTFEEIETVRTCERIPIDKHGEPSMRMLDFVAPIVRGQRMLVEEELRCNKLSFVKKFANEVTKDNQYSVIFISADSRPEDTNNLEEECKGTALFTPDFAKEPAEQIRWIEMGLSRAKRIAEAGKNCVVLIDSFTKIVNLYDAALTIDDRDRYKRINPKAIAKVKEMMALSRCLKNGGSITVLGFVEVETGSANDEYIYDCLSGFECGVIRLSRALAKNKILPPIHAGKSWSDNAEFVQTARELECVNYLRRTVDEDCLTEEILHRMKDTHTKGEMLKKIKID